MATGKFFMSLSDIRFWVRSAQSDAQLQRLRREHGEAQSFDLLYQKRKDPWGLGSSHFRYQQIKYATMLSLLPKRRYRRALDLGCGLGSLTKHLGKHADQVLGVDVSHVAIARATQETASCSNVRFQQGDVLNLSRNLENGFDLVVLADTLYYLSPLTNEVLEAACERVARLLVPDGILLLANHYICKLDPGSRWSPKIHQVFRSASDLTSLHEDRRFFYLVSVLEKSRSHE